ncbi:putative 2-keto-3-deoxygluconate dehydrogenase [Kalymmatonema gypsitolerans NIES-4073]|nr:putative 2-keto-3-deoxygluconate dehydrogenase [Scytonema sp. NIES-4073]
MSKKKYPRKTNPITRRRLLVSGSTVAGLAAVGSNSLSQLSAQQPQTNNQNQKAAMGRLQGQIAFITGAARGIGRACAVALAKEGSDIALVDIAADIPSTGYKLGSESDLMETKRLVEAEGRRAIAIQADVRNLQQLRSAVANTIQTFGKIDIAVPNAGILTMGNLVDMNEAAWNDVIDVNLTGVAYTMMAVLPHMRDRKYGRIIVTVSCNSRWGAPGSPSYNASKWGALGLVKSVASEVAKDGITVNCVNPTGVATPMSLQPKYRDQFSKFLRTQFNAQDRDFLKPEEVAAAMIFFAMPEASTITGEALDIAAGANTRWSG